jgi:hypothetical protein
MSGLQAVIEAIDQEIGGFTPEGRDQTHQFFTGLPEVYSALGSALHKAADNMDGEHIHDSVIESTHELGTTTSGIADTAEDTYSEHVKRHDIWLKD